VYDYGKEHGLNWLHPQDKDRKQPGRSISSVVLRAAPGQAWTRRRPCSRTLASS
ncbi:unnamed protein product, partial [Prorocentrum cordatum]